MRSFSPCVKISRGTFKTTVDSTCEICKITRTKFQIPSHTFDRFLSGIISVQQIMGITPDEREILLSGICGTCYDDMFIDSYSD